VTTLSRGRRAVLVVGGLLALAAVAWTTLSIVSVLGRTTDTRVDDLAAPSERLEVRTSSGSVDITPASDGRVRVQTRSRYGLRAPALEQRDEGGTLRLDADCAAYDTICSVDYVIAVPSGLGVVVRTGSGDIAVSGSSAAVSAHTGSGSVTVDGVTGDVDLKTGSGSVRGRGVTSEAANARTGSGDIDLEFLDPPLDVRAQTGSGDVTLDLPGDQAYAVDLDTGSGDQTVDVDVSSRSPHKVRGRTGSGDITVRPVG
jgi:hypothetical protein